MAKFILNQTVTSSRKGLADTLKDMSGVTADILPYKAYLSYEDRPAINTATELRNVINHFGKDNVSFQVVPSYSAHKSEIFIPMKSFNSFSEAVEYADELVDQPNQDGVVIKPSYITIAVYVSIRHRSDRSAFADL